MIRMAIAEYRTTARMNLSARILSAKSDSLVLAAFTTDMVRRGCRPPIDWRRGVQIGPPEPNMVAN